MNLVLGLLFGLSVGGGFWYWGGISMTTASLVCLTAMASIWLGISFAPDQRTRMQLQELMAAAITFGIIGIALMRTPLWFCAGFAFQLLWSALHRGGRVGASVQDLYPGFAASANLGFILVFCAAWFFA